MTPEDTKKPDSTQKHKKPRHRSPNYPAIGLRSAVEKITAIYKADGLAPCLRDAALKHMGFEKFHGEAARVLSALKSFGLIEETNGRIKLTQLGIDIVARSDMDMQRGAALQGAAVGPEIYRDLLKQYKDSGLPSDTALKSELSAVKKFNPNAVDDFIRDFRDSLEFAGLPDIRVINWELESEQMPETDPKPLVKGSPPPPRRVALLPHLPSNQQDAFLRHDVFSLTEGEVRIQWPAILTAESAQDLADWLDIVKRKIGRSVAAKEDSSER